MTEIQGKSISVRVNARLEFIARVRVIGSRLYEKCLLDLFVFTFLKEILQRKYDKSSKEHPPSKKKPSTDQKIFPHVNHLKSKLAGKTGDFEDDKGFL